MPPYCEARVLVWYGCAALENTSVADVYYEYSSGGLDNEKWVTVKAGKQERRTERGTEDDQI